MEVEELRLTDKIEHKIIQVTINKLIKVCIKRKQSQLTDIN